MIRIRIELVPGGIEALTREIGRIELANLGPDSEATHKYGMTMIEEANPVTGAPAQGMKGVIRKHNRKQSIFILLNRAARLIADRIKATPISSGLHAPTESVSE